MKCDELAVIEVFSKNLTLELTINQIKQEIKKSYCFTNALVHSMIKDEILTKKVFGHSIVCSLNKESNLTISLLALNSSIKKEKLPNYETHWRAKLK